LPCILPIPDLLQSSEFWAAIVGALVGGLIAYIVQIKALREARRDRAEERVLIKKGLANSLMFKMFRIQSNLRIVHQHILDCLKRAKDKNLEGSELWQLVSPIGNPPHPVHFTSDEMSMLLDQKDNDVFNSVASMDTVIEMVGLYKEERFKLADLFPPPHGEHDQLFFGFHSRQEWLALRPQMVNVNSVIEQLQGYVADGAKQADDVLNRLQKLLKQKGLISFEIQLKPAAS
jgi:hypothetical protein